MNEHDNVTPFATRSREAARERRASASGPRGPFELEIGGRNLVAVRDELATHGWRFYEQRADTVLGGTRPVEVPPPAYDDVMSALTARERE
jgi:hypothetical protein